ncbi:MAG: M48 family metallopeptidase [Pyrinomonadaceae bacterium]
MAENIANRKCSNGHDQPASGSKFCIYCGIAVGVERGQNRFQQPQTPPQNQQYHQPNPPPASPNYQGQANNQQQYYQQQQQYPPPQYIPVGPPSCYTCGGDPNRLPDKVVICKECRTLKPLVPGYRVDSSAFAWAADAKAMSVLRSMTPLSMLAKAVSERVGRRWIEVTFNGVLLSEKQMPHIFGQAVRAARILGMSHMPDVYISGERAWDCLTFGTDNDSFIVVGSALAGNFQGVDMLFLLAREMGHAKAGHALWKTVIRFFLGEQGPAKGFMAGGIFNALSPTALIGGAIEMPLLAWARQAEITADRAGMLTVGNEEVARRVLLSWSLKSSLMYRQINIESWLKQQAVDDDSYLKLSELTTSSTPYLGPRLRLLSDFAKSPELQNSLRIISETIKASAPPPPAKLNADPDVLRFKCATCQAPMKVPRNVLDGKAELPVKCPNAKCGAITRLKKNAKTATAPKAAKLEENLNYGD